MILADPKSHDEWISTRKSGIGGSDAACVIGLNKYKSNVQLWQEKTGISQPEDISNKPAVVYGKHAESHLRELFALDFPQYDIEYHEFRMYANEKYPFIFATLDGELTDETGKKGILEIKTTTIQNSSQWEEWDGGVPQNYYIQLLHQLIATGWNFAILKAHIRYFKNNDIYTSTRHYFINRDEVFEDMKILIESECKFWEHVKNKTKPALILPEI